MMRSLSVLVVAAMAFVASFAHASYCSAIHPPVPQCATAEPRDILFLVDGSQSMNRERFYTDMLDYCLSLYCAFRTTSPNQVGMILFNQVVEVIIPLGQYTQNEWFNLVNQVRATQNSSNPACCSCCTPTADAFDLATQEFATHGKNAITVAVVITDGVPSNNVANTGGNPAWWWYNPKQGFNPATYNLQIVPERAAALKAAGHRLFLVGVPDATNTPPQQAFFDGDLPKGSKQCVTRANKQFCGIYNVPPLFPIVSEPVAQNSFSSNTWNVSQLISQTVGALCVIPPTSSPSQPPTTPTTVGPTSPAPTMPPTTLSPTTARPTTGSPTTIPPLSQMDVTFLLDRSFSMIWHDGVCGQIIASRSSSSVKGKATKSNCWALFMEYVLNQVDGLTQIPSVGGAPLGWADDFTSVSSPARGLRVNVIGFSCVNHQKTPKVWTYSLDLNGGPITNRDALVKMLDTLQATVVPDGGTCPGLAIETVVRNVEDTSPQNYPLQTAILISDFVFYDSPFPEIATGGLEAYKVLRFAIGIAVASSNFSYGLSPTDIVTQRTQLLDFVGGDKALAKNLDTDGWGLLPQIAQEIATDLPNYYYKGNPIPRYTWCGWRRIAACAYENYRFGHCKWSGPTSGSWQCKPK